MGGGAVRGGVEATWQLEAVPIGGHCYCVK